MSADRDPQRPWWLGDEDRRSESERAKRVTTGLDAGLLVRRQQEAATSSRLRRAAQAALPPPPPAQAVAPADQRLRPVRACGNYLLEHLGRMAAALWSRPSVAHADGDSDSRVPR